MHVLQTLETCPLRSRSDATITPSSRTWLLALALITSVPSRRNRGQPLSEAKLWLKPAGETEDSHWVKPSYASSPPTEARCVQLQSISWHSASDFSNTVFKFADQRCYYAEWTVHVDLPVISKQMKVHLTICNQVSKVSLVHDKHGTEQQGNHNDALLLKTEGPVRKVWSKPLQCDTMETKLALKMEQQKVKNGLRCRMLLSYQETWPLSAASSRLQIPRLRNDLYCVEWDVKL